MADLKATSTVLPAGGGEFKLDRLTIGVFSNDQPTHRFSLGKDKAENIPLTANQGWILPPGATGICTYDAPLEVMMVEVAPRVLAEVGMDDPTMIAPVVGSLDTLTLELALGAENFNRGGTLYRETMHRALAVQLSQTLRTINDAARSIEDIRLRRVVEYIHDNLAEDLTLESMSNLAAMSGFHFSRAFKAATGKSPLQYVIAERIALAKVLLKTTGLSVSEICFRTGYNDLSRFGQHFKRATGTTPANFRAQ
ncbi:helix-turn-helix domain-containing protein [Hoeflea prorocentri]|uniref:AraC family transcriptional regulator n=1 Tax=Hoeflea prorocentri TaxID=1922333 RepID=A0A9X3UHP7_9HYPH|nr:AraC family transcriptional regulator [Hoeflea prorocentri]MCY6381603.1 AraC family transcriptional regulator [Hoeflea prorocentri]MDA5399403.1 AraC family transcriptional regulator [Hoeflea prorocentri]